MVNIDDFVADRTDAAEGIRSAIRYARSAGETTIRFSAGDYLLRDAVRIETSSIAHDDGCGDIHEKDCHIAFSGMDRLTIVGETDACGNPATRLIGCHGWEIQTRLASILWAENCRSLTLCNIAFTRAPQTAFCGIIEDVSESGIAVRVTSTEEIPDEMGAYCMNRFDPVQKKLVGESLTIGFGYDRRFVKTGAHTAVLRDAGLAQKLKAGEGLSWHMSGLTDFLLFFGGCDDLSLLNVRVENTNGFAVLTENCEGIRADRLILAPADGLFFTGPRDGWKIYRCSGKIQVENSRFEGFRMDAQNIQSNFFILEAVKNDTKLIFSCKYAPIPLKNGVRLRLHTQDGEERYATIRSWRFLPGKMAENVQAQDASAGRAVPGKRNHISRYEIELEEDPDAELRNALKEGMLAEPLCWEPESYTCKNTVFRNIAGAGHLVRCRNANIEGNLYENLMCAGVLIGAELDTHCESGHGRNIRIAGNTFRNIGFKPRYGRYGCAAVATKSQGFSGPYNRNIIIENNSFENCNVAVELWDAADVIVRNNRYARIRQRIVADGATTINIHSEED